MLPLIENVLPSIIAEGRSINTRKSYHYSFKQWQEWAFRNGCIPLPANELSFATFLGYLISKNASFPKIHNIFYAVKHYHIISRSKDPCKSFVVKRLYDAARRRCKKGFNKKRALTVEDIKMLHNYLASNDDLENLRTWTMIIIMFTGFLRFDEASNIQRGHIDFHRDHVSIFLPESKGDIYRDGDSVVIAKIEGSLCPVSALRTYITVTGTNDDKLFLFRAITKTKTKQYLRRKNVPISYNTVRNKVLVTGVKAGIDCSRVGTHSLRAGGSSIAANNGTNDRLLKRHGRWRSDRSKDGYVQDNLERRLSVTRNLGL